MKKILIFILVFAFTMNTTNAWLGLTAQVGDLLNISKWNEMIDKLNTKLDQSNIVGSSNIEVNNSGTGVIISLTGSVSASSIPYITSGSKTITTSTTKNINITGLNFVPSTTVSIPGWAGTINSTTINSPTDLDINITASTTAATYDFVISNSTVQNTLWTGNGVGQLTVFPEILGTGLAGTYTEDFEVSLGSWVSSGLTGDWTRDSGGTPSNGTGPTTGAGGSTWYMYTEVSNGADANEFGIETSDFRHATSVSLNYHMFGPDIGTLYIQTLYLGTWTTVWSISGQQQAAQADPYLNTGNIDLTGYQVEKIRILMNGATSWGGDTAVDNISIISN
ncbi:MAG: hypothetical protein Q9M94_00995 [Candidatus Gracilibacteria bacterium]|nr:hypothetical protein [Candidatus Gracilibacteria bacterium]